MTLSPARARVFGRRRERCARSARSTRYAVVVVAYLTSASGIFLLRRTFRTEPQDLEDAARIEGGVPLAGQCALGLSGLSRLRPRVGELAQEQFSLAADHHEFRRAAAADGLPLGVRLDRPGNRVVHADDRGAAPPRVSRLPVTVRAVVHERRPPVRSSGRALKAAERDRP